MFMIALMAVCAAVSMNLFGQARRGPAFRVAVRDKTGASIGMAEVPYKKETGLPAVHKPMRRVNTGSIRTSGALQH